MAEFGTCKRCHWEYIQEMSFVRRQPWTTDDAGLMFQTCQRCGNISIQRFMSDGAVAGVWILSPDAIVMFRMGVPPNQVFDYAFSDDFFGNRGITLGLLQGSMRSMLDLSPATNLLLNRLGRLDDIGQISLSLDILRSVLTEHAARLATDGEARLHVSTLRPLAELMQGRAVGGNAATSLADARFVALELLESFVQPELWQSLPQAETTALEEAIDHLSMVENSAARFRHMADNLDDEVAMQLFVEAKFIYRVFRRRQARLSRLHAESVWRALTSLDRQFDVSNPLLFASKAFEAARGLLEHQLVESGFFKVGPRTVEGQQAIGFRSPNTGEVLALPQVSTRLYLFSTPQAQEPAAVLDDWGAAMDRL